MKNVFDRCRTNLNKLNMDPRKLNPRNDSRPYVPMSSGSVLTLLRLIITGIMMKISYSKIISIKSERKRIMP